MPRDDMRKKALVEASMIEHVTTIEGNVNLSLPRLRELTLHLDFCTPACSDSAIRESVDYLVAQT